MKTPNFITIEDFTYINEQWESKTIKVGTFVRPIDESYIPEHVFKHPQNKFFDPGKEVFVYFSKGIMAIPKKIIRST